MTDVDRPTISLAHSPDPDDAFMWWPLLDTDGPPAIDTGGVRFKLHAADIEQLNAAADSSRFDITALSCAHYPRVAGSYDITSCGASLGAGYGPRLVAAAPRDVQAFRASAPRIAIPGERTTAAAVLRLLMNGVPHETVVVPFERIIDEVAAGSFDAGVVIHEGQLTFHEAGLHLVTDLGAWWSRQSGLPLPLGLNVIRRDLENRLGPGTLARVTRTLLASVRHALEHRARSIEYALGFARGLDAERANRFIGMYVNAWTLEFGPEGRAAVRSLLDAGAAAGLFPPVDEVRFVDPAP